MHTWEVPLKHIYKTKWLHNETALEGKMLSKYTTACEKHSQKAQDKTMLSGTKNIHGTFLDRDSSHRHYIRHICCYLISSFSLFLSGYAHV